MLKKFFCDARIRRLAAAIFTLVSGSAIPTSSGHAAEVGLLHLRCTNAAGGANWPIVIDLDQHLVDSFPARITETWVSWRNPNGGVYELERSTGNLQLRAASSTGGYFLHYNCKPE
jgi:hypothetical protein